jgi:hypothetical protein
MTQHLNVERPMEARVGRENQSEMTPTRTIAHNLL